MTRGVFHRQVPFVGSGDLYGPGPRPPHAFAMQRPLDDALTPSWVLADPAPFTSAQSDASGSLRTTRSPTLSRRRPLRLGHCSLLPSLFWERCVGAYSRPDTACRLLQLLTTYGHSARALVSSQGRRPRPPSFSYASRTASSCSQLPATLKSGDARRAAHASDRLISVPVSSRLREFARPRYRIDRATLTLGDRLAPDENRVS